MSWRQCLKQCVVGVVMLAAGHFAFASEGVCRFLCLARVYG